MVAECPRCGLEFEREEGYWLGAIILNTLVSGSIIALVFTAVVGITWPEVPGWPLVLICLPIALGLPIAFYPVSKTLWVAIDRSFLHPMKPWRRRKWESD